VFAWANFRHTKAAVKLHTLLDLRGNIPTFIRISERKLHDVNLVDALVPEPGAYYVMDRGYLDDEGLYLSASRAPSSSSAPNPNLQFRRLYSRAVNKSRGLRCDQSIVLTGFYSAQRNPQQLRRIKYYHAESDKASVFLTNNFSPPASTIAEPARWQVELFFKWIKQHQRIKAFFGTS
jgi:hypothetical protein